MERLLDVVDGLMAKEECLEVCPHTTLGPV